MKKGKVYLVGAGPGNPDLITLAGIKAIKKADVIVYDYLANDRILSFASPKSEKIYAGKKGASHTLEQSKINKLLIKKARAGKIVVRLKGGDPFILGRGGEEAMALAEANIPLEIVPGVTSPVAASAYAGIPLTHRDYTSTVVFVTGHEDPLKKDSAMDWNAISRMGTIVFLMGFQNLSRIIEKLLDCGMSPTHPVAVIQWGTLPIQKTVTGNMKNIVAKVKEAGLSSPAIIVVGNVVKLRNKLNWFETKPLFGRRILITRSREQASELRDKLEERGAEVIEFPTIRIAAPASWESIDRAINELNSFDWLVFTSVNGVDMFFQRLVEKGRDIRDLKGIKIATIGSATAQSVEKHGLRVDIKPGEYIAEGIVQEFKKIKDIHNAKILLPRASDARDVLPRELKKLGAKVTEIKIYRTLPDRGDVKKVLPLFKNGEVDFVTFTSSSTVRNFVRAIGEKNLKHLLRTRFVSIGQITSATARELGLKISAEAKEHTIPGLVSAIEKLK